MSMMPITCNVTIGTINPFANMTFLPIIVMTSNSINTVEFERKFMRPVGVYIKIHPNKDRILVCEFSTHLDILLKV
jgi:hypothetical protein